MKWKDSEEILEKQEKPKDESFNEEQYSPWAERKEPLKSPALSKLNTAVILPVIIIAALVIALLVVLWKGQTEESSGPAIAALEEKLRLAQERLDKFEAIDEKVTRIWEQAKTFEQFKERFDRSEASSTLRMDHLTVNMEALQKQLSELRKSTAPVVKVEAPPKTEAKPAKSEARPAQPEIKPDQPEIGVIQAEPKPVQKAAPSGYHQVAAGETIYGISRKYKMSVKELLDANNLGTDAVLRIGQKLKVNK